MGIVLVALGAISVIYGISVFLVGSGTWFFLFWFALGAVLAGVGACVHLGMWSALPTALRYGLYAFFGIAMLAFAGVATLVFGDFHDTGEDDLDYLVVLGAQVHEWGPSTVLQYRLDAAVDYLERNPKTTCIVSGGQGPNEHAPEAEVMAEYLVAHGIEESRILREDKSLNTNQNIAYSSTYFDSKNDRIGIVTNNFHVYRACKIAAKQGIAHACGIAAYTTPWYVPNNVVRETLGIAKDFAVGNL